MSDHHSGNPSQRNQSPWSVSVPVAQIPVTGLHKVIAPTPQEAQSLASLGGLLHATNIRAEFTLTPLRGDQIRVDGRVTGTVGQTCVVTLDPLDNDVNEAVELIFAPADQVRALAASLEDTDDAQERPDPPEPIENGAIDLGHIASDALFLGLDPYPRKPDAVFQPPAVAQDPEDHPFAALKALKPDG